MFQRTTILTLAIVAVLASAAQGVQVQDLVRIKGSETTKLTGMGLVVGLRGTGDGAKSGPAIKALAALTQHFMDPTSAPPDFKDAKNVAVVFLSAEVPATGVREGDKLDVHISAPSAKSLEGGRLFLFPMTGPNPDSPVYAFAEGSVTVENAEQANHATVKSGAQMVSDVRSKLLDDQGRITLVINDSVASWPMSNNLAGLVNGVISPDGPNIAKAVDQKNVVIDVPSYERRDPAAFISQILLSYVDPSQIGTGARVVVNAKTGTIIVSGDVQISPVIINHKGLTITTITPAPQANPTTPVVEENTFLALDPEKRGGPRLADLLSAFNQLKVEAPDRIAILREINRSGKLHAQWIEE